jgi:transposase
VPMVPTLTATLGVKGHRPVVGHRDNKDVLYVFGTVNLVTAVLHTNLLEKPQHATRRTGLSKTRQLQAAFAKHLRHLGHCYPKTRYPEVILLIDNAPWHRGVAITAALADQPHLRLYRLPSYSPQLNPIERFWKKLRRRATHNRLFDTIADLKSAVRASLGYFQMVRSKVKSILDGRHKRTTK